MFGWLRRRSAGASGGSPGDLLSQAETLRIAVQQSADPQLLRTALATAERATGSADPQSAAMAWSILCVLHRTSAARGGGSAERDRAVQAGRQAVTLAEDGSEVWFRSMSALATALMDRHARQGDAAALHEAVALNRRIVDGLDIDSPEYPGMLGNLTNVLKLLYGAEHDPAVLEEAVVVGREAVGLTERGDRQFATVRINLASVLAVQAAHLRSRAPIDEAREHMRVALAALPPSHPDRPIAMQFAGDLERVAAAL